MAKDNWGGDAETEERKTLSEDMTSLDVSNAAGWELYNWLIMQYLNSFPVAAAKIILKCRQM